MKKIVYIILLLGIFIFNNNCILYPLSILENSKECVNALIQQKMNRFCNEFNIRCSNCEHIEIKNLNLMCQDCKVFKITYEKLKVFKIIFDNIETLKKLMNSNSNCSGVFFNFMNEHLGTFEKPAKGYEETIMVFQKINWSLFNTDFHKAFNRHQFHI